MPSYPMRRSDLPFQPETIGHSVRHQPIPYVPAAGGCDVLFIAGIHGEEPETVVCLSRAYRSLEQPSQNCASILCANPDGITLGTRCNANGVDLNRNFPAENWQATPTHYRWHVEEESDIQIGTGANPGSEPETQVILEMIKRLQPRIIVALHGPLACIDDPDNSREAQWIAEKTGLPLVTEIGYPTPGSFGSWAAERNLPVITWEFPADGIESLSKSQTPTILDILSGNSPLTKV